MPDDQLVPLIADNRRRARKKTLKPAADNPVARVALTSLQTALLDREFDFLVSEKHAEAAKPGVRVRVPFRGQLIDGFIVARLPASDHLGELAYLKSVVSPEPVLTPQIYALVQAVAAYYAGTTADVLRFAIPPRHARAEADLSAEPVSAEFMSAEPVSVELLSAPPTVALPVPPIVALPAPPTAALPAPPASPLPVPPQWQRLWQLYQGGTEFLASAAVTAATTPKDHPQPKQQRYVWTPLPGLAPPIPPATVPDQPLWAAEIAVATAAVVANHRDVVIVAPDLRDVERIIAALAAVGLADRTARLVAEDGPEQRYQAFLKANRGLAQVVVGTRAAAFAPMPNLGLLVLWGDGEDTLIEPQTPYYHTREVLALRSYLEQVTLLVGGIGREITTQLWVQDGLAAELAPNRQTLRVRAPRVKVLDQAALASENSPGRIPSAAWRVIHDGLARGPVLVQVPRTGYRPSLACANCRARARCSQCQGVLQQPDAAQPPVCRTCGFVVLAWRCPHCQGVKLRSMVVGAARTAEELGRAFPGARVITSAADAAGGVRSLVDANPALVIATPGGEPVAAGGYAAAVLLDASAPAAHVGLDAETHALRRWLAAANLVVPARAGGQVVLVGEAAPEPARALVLFEPAWFAGRQLDERVELGLPPVTRAAVVTGDDYAVAALVSRVQIADAEVFGSMPWEPVADEPTLLDTPKVRTLIRVPRAAGSLLAQQLKAVMVTRAAKREPGQARIHLDPAELF